MAAQKAAWAKRSANSNAAATFPKHPFAHAGLAKINIVEGDLRGARLVLQAQLSQGPTADIAAVVGDLSAELGDAATADQ